MSKIYYNSDIIGVSLKSKLSSGADNLASISGAASSLNPPKSFSLKSFVSNLSNQYSKLSIEAESLVQWCTKVVNNFEINEERSSALCNIESFKMSEITLGNLLTSSDIKRELEQIDKQYKLESLSDTSASEQYKSILMHDRKFAEVNLNTATTVNADKMEDFKKTINIESDIKTQDTTIKGSNNVIGQINANSDVTSSYTDLKGATSSSNIFADSTVSINKNKINSPSADSLKTININDKKKFSQSNVEIGGFDAKSKSSIDISENGI